MPVMRFQFSTKTLLLAITVTSITCCAMLFWWRSVTHGYNSFWKAVEWYLIDSLLWFPAIFVAFAIGRRALTVRMVICFAVAEAIAVAYFYFVFVLPGY